MYRFFLFVWNNILNRGGNMKKQDILDEIIKNTTELIRFKTTQNNFLEFDKAFNLIKKELKNYNIKEVVINQYTNLIISNVDTTDFDIIFCGHIDVVSSAKYEATICGNNLCGRGTFDMKSQLAVMISLLKNNKINKKIGLIITSDEEIGGACCKEILKNYSASLAVIPDAGKDFKLIVEEKGLLQVSIKVKGIKAHGSEPFNGKNAIIKAFSLYEELLKIYPMPENTSSYITSINLSKLNGGIANNIVPDEAIMVLDIRFTNDTNKKEILSNIRKIAKDSEIDIIDYGPTFYVDHQLPIIQKFINKASEILNKELIIDKCLATSDAIYFSEKGIPTILINPIGDYWHTEKEYVNIDSLYTLYYLFKTLL